MEVRSILAQTMESGGTSISSRPVNLVNIVNEVCSHSLVIGGDFV
jgi:hypothetical protein